MHSPILRKTESFQSSARFSVLLASNSRALVVAGGVEVPVVHAHEARPLATRQRPELVAGGGGGFGPGGGFATGAGSGGGAFFGGGGTCATTNGAAGGNLGGGGCGADHGSMNCKGSGPRSSSHAGNGGSSTGGGGGGGLAP